MINHSFGIQVTMNAQKGKGDELARIMQATADLVENFPGCQTYIVLKMMSDPDQVMITEIWDSQKAHEASLADKEVISLINQARPIITHMEHHAGRPLTGPYTVLRHVCA